MLEDRVLEEETALVVVAALELDELVLAVLALDALVDVENVALGALEPEVVLDVVEPDGPDVAELAEPEPGVAVAQYAERRDCTAATLRYASRLLKKPTFA